MITEVKLKVELPATETLPVSDIDHVLKWAVVMNHYSVAGLFAHKSYAERYIKTYADEGDRHVNFTIREVAE